MTLNNAKITLVNNTIKYDEIQELSSWLLKDERLTKDKLTLEFEEAWCKWQNRKYSIFVNSGSSANLAMIYAMILSKRLKNKNIIVPAVSWVTTVSPIIQLGLTPILCDCDPDTLGVDITHLEELFITNKPSALVIVHVLAFPNKMTEIKELCNKYDVILLEDSCESVGSTYNNIKTGNFGLISTFSTYYGHAFSTIEGGLITTDDEELYNIILSIRSHGWDRDLNINTKQKLRQKYNISELRALYTFYYPGFNLRSTDLQAKIGLLQLTKLDDMLNKRKHNFEIYNNLIVNNYWKIKNYDNTEIYNFAYPIIHPKVDEIYNNLIENNIECRPLVCGSMGKQPFWIELYGETKLNFADIVHEFGLYVPNNPDLNDDDIIKICEIINKTIN